MFIVLSLKATCVPSLVTSGTTYWSYPRHPCSIVVHGWCVFVWHPHTHTNQHVEYLKPSCRVVPRRGAEKRHLGGAYLHFILSPKEVKTSASSFLILLNVNYYYHANLYMFGERGGINLHKFVGKGTSLLGRVESTFQYWRMHMLWLKNNSLYAIISLCACI